jgi:hypothetical protein
MCAFEGKATTHSQFLASDIFRVALRERTYLGHRQIIEICVVRGVVPFFVLTVGTGRKYASELVTLSPDVIPRGLSDVRSSPKSGHSTA